MDATPFVAPVPSSAHAIPERVAERAISRYVVELATRCHISTYSVASHGYAQIGWNLSDGSGKNAGTTAHRAAWTAVHGPIPAGMTIDHTCKNRRCVNVNHLRMLTNHENSRRTAGRDWPLGQCVNGHDNKHLTYTDGGRRVKCGICMKEWSRRNREKRRNAAIAQAA